MEQSIADEVAVLARRLQSVLDPAVRVAYVRDRLLQRSAPEIAVLMILATTAAEARQPEHVDLLLVLSLALADDQHAELRLQIAHELDQRDQALLARALRPDAGIDTNAGERFRIPDFGFGRPLTLGERKSLARRKDRNLLARVARDPDPAVIRILLGNPALTEADVIRLCAARPLPPTIQREVFRAPRWVTRYAVRLTLVLNPYTPLDVALQLAPHLSRQDQLRVCNAEDLSGLLRDDCRRRVDPVTLH